MVFGLQRRASFSRNFLLATASSPGVYAPVPTEKLMIIEVEESDLLKADCRGDTSILPKNLLSDQKSNSGRY